MRNDSLSLEGQLSFLPAAVLLHPGRVCNAPKLCVVLKPRGAGGPPWHGFLLPFNWRGDLTVPYQEQTKHS